MNYSLLPYFGSPVTQTIVISDSEYKALRQAEARDQIERIEERIRTYEAAIAKLHKEVGYIKSRWVYPRLTPMNKLLKLLQQAERATSHKKAKKVLKKYAKLQDKQAQEREQ